MKKLVIYYSYSGNTKKIAEELAMKDSADIFEIKDIKRPGKLKAYTAGIIAAMKCKAWQIIPPDIEIDNYEKLIMLAPVWAGNPPPAFNAMLELLPSGKFISIKMVSASGESNCEGILDIIITSKGCTFESFEDIRVKR